MAVNNQLDFEALNTIVSIINYGGRVTDQNDMRLLNYMIADYVNPGIDQDDFKFTALPFYSFP